MLTKDKIKAQHLIIMCCALILSLVKILFPFVYGSTVMYHNEYKTKGNKI